jgi:hypothetical protein
LLALVQPERLTKRLPQIAVDASIQPLRLDLRRPAAKV